MDFHWLNTAAKPSWFDMLEDSIKAQQWQIPIVNGFEFFLFVIFQAATWPFEMPCPTCCNYSHQKFHTNLAYMHLFIFQVIIVVPSYTSCSHDLPVHCLYNHQHLIQGLIIKTTLPSHVHFFSQPLQTIPMFHDCSDLVFSKVLMHGLVIPSPKRLLFDCFQAFFNCIEGVQFNLRIWTRRTYLNVFHWFTFFSSSSATLPAEWPITWGK